MKLDEPDLLSDNDLSSGELGLGDDFLNDDLSGGFFGGDDSAPMAKYPDLLKQLTSFDAYTRNCVNGWLGLVWDEKEEKYVRNPHVHPVMNIHGAQWCIDFLRTYTRDNNILTDISQDDYYALYEDIIRVVWLNVGTRMEEFGITENGDAWRISTEVIHASMLVLMGAGDGKYSKLLGTVTHRTETLNMNPQQQTQPQMTNPIMAGGYVMPQMPGAAQPKQSVLGKIKSFVTGAK